MQQLVFNFDKQKYIGHQRKSFCINHLYILEAHYKYGFITEKFFKRWEIRFNKILDYLYSIE